MTSSARRPARKVAAKAAAQTTAAPTELAPQAAPPAIVEAAVKAVAKPVVKTAAKKVSPVAAKPARQAVAAEPVQVPAAKPAKKPKEVLVRDSFTMPDADFALIAALKKTAMGAGREAKKSELLRAGLQALAALKPAALVAALNQLAPVKQGRPRKGH
jgi:type IV secretory pathway TrbL component